MYLRDRVETLAVESALLSKMLQQSPGLSSDCSPSVPGGAPDLVLVFGGDGTILRAIRMFDRGGIVCGVNMGRMGFLSQVEPKDLQSALEKLLSGKFSTSERMKLDVKLNGEMLGSALNELLVIGERIGKIFRGRLEIEGFGGLGLEGDGVIVSTPTGSTGHSLSSGGSVIDTELDAFMISPLAAMVPIRPLVVSARKMVSVLPEDRCTLAIDGAESGAAPSGSVIEVTKSPSKVRFAIMDGDWLWSKLRQRIGG